MKPEKSRTNELRPESAATQRGNQKNRSQILIYILILFIAAFLLMTLSFLSHQHSNEQVLGQLSNKVNTLEQLQAALEENVQLQVKINAQNLQTTSLQDELDTAKASQAKLAEQITALEQNAAQQKQELDALRKTASALDALTQLQLQLIAGDMDACRKMIADMEGNGLDKLLPSSSGTPGGVSPLEMFQQAKLLTEIPAAENVSRETTP